jgi:hypothetical protein
MKVYLHLLGKNQLSKGPTEVKINITLAVVLFGLYFCSGAMAQELPLVYDVENTGADVPEPNMPALGQLPVINSLPDPFRWADSTRGRIKYYSDWRARRAEIGYQIQHYEIGIKPPRPDTITANYSQDTLTVNVTVNGQTLTLKSRVILPPGKGPFPVVIGIMTPTGSIPDSIFSDRHIAEIAYNINQVTTYYNFQNSDPYFKLYPNLNTTNIGQYSAWAWGVSRIIDGLELVQNSLPIDLKHIAVTGCSYAGKLALFAGAFDERIALTIAQESGGGGATSWRYSHYSSGTGVEEIDNTNYDWFADSLRQFAGDNVYRLPYDHHELMAMVAPRALYVTGNPDYTWLSNPSCYVASAAAQRVYEGLGIPDRFGYSIVGGHSHCLLPDIQVPDIQAFVDRFLLGDSTQYTFLATSPYNIDLTPWITWSIPKLMDTTATLIRGDSRRAISSFRLEQNYPNPFNPATTIKYDLLKESHVRLIVYDVLGRQIAKLVDGIQQASEHSVEWNPAALSSGVYFCRIEARATDGTETFSAVKKLVYMK